MDSIRTRVQSLYGRALAVSVFSTHVGITIGTNLILGVLTIATGAMAARLLRPEGRGELAAIQSWSAFIATIALLGFPDAVVYFSGREPTRARTYWFSATVLALFFGTPFILVGWWVMPWLLAAQLSAAISTARWYVLGLFLLFAVQWMPLAALRGRSDFLVWNILQFLPVVGWFGVLIASWTFNQRIPSFVALAYLFVLGILSIPIALVAWRRIAGSLSLDTELCHRMFRYGFPLGLAAIPQALLSSGRLAQMTMAALLEPRSLGLFAVAVAWGNITGPLTHALGVVLFPDVASRPTESEKGLALARGLRLAALLAVTLTLPLLLVTPFTLPTLFGEDFRSGVPAAIVMVLAGGIMGFKMVLDQGFRGLGKPGTVLIADTIGLVSTGGLLLFLISPFGIIGAGVALLVGYVATVFILLVNMQRITQLSMGELIYPTRIEVQALWRRFYVVLNFIRLRY